MTPPFLSPNVPPGHEQPPSEDPRDRPLSTHLVIPYFHGDRGVQGVHRPLPAGVCWYLCPSIVVNGKPGNNFQRGVPTSITVDVANYGAGSTSAAAHVMLWWNDPTTGFTKPTFFGQDVIPSVPPTGEVRRSQPIVNTIPLTAPAHVCLLARVTSALDQLLPGDPIAPGGERHWAQLNVVEITTTVGNQFQFVFWAGNPLARATTFDVVARPVTGAAHEFLTRATRIETAPLDRVPMVFRDQRADDHHESPNRREPRRQLTLEAGERRPLQIIGEVPAHVEPGRTVAIEIVQTTGDPNGRQEVTGGLALLVTVARR